MARSKRYVDDSGAYLAAVEYFGTWRIAWYCPESSDYGSSLGESGPSDGSSVDDAERLAAAAVEPLSDGRDGGGFHFASERRARAALRAANEAILAGHVWPDWARKARDAGWTPPAGWTP